MPTDEKTSQETINALLARDIAYIKDSIELMRDEITEWKQNYVTQKEFWPVKVLAYGLVALVMASFFAALIWLVFHVRPPTA